MRIFGHVRGAALLAPLSLFIALPGGADAQCTFNHSPKARGVKLSMVRATDRCETPNATTTEGISACSPPTTPSAYSFADSSSKCEMKVSHKATTECGVNPSCSAVTFAVKCSGILDGAYAPIDGETGWLLRMSLRITGDDTANSDMTIIDAPLDAAFPPAQSGKLALKLTRTTYTVTDAPIPNCASIDLVQDEVITPFSRDVIVATVVDPDGNAFARIGTAGSAEGSPGCGIDLPSKTKSIKGSLVRAFEGCPIPSFPVPNSQTADGVPACAPPYAASLHHYDAKSGGCSLALTQKLGECVGTCAPLTLSLKCKGVLQGNTSNPLNETGWKARLTLRASTTDPSAGDATVTDLPVDVSLPAFVDGKLTVQSKLQDLPATPGPLELRGCTALELVDARLLDALGNDFARLGTASFSD